MTATDQRLAEPEALAAERARRLGQVSAAGLPPQNTQTPTKITVASLTAAP